MNAICFDLDGTLTDPKLGIIRSIRYALERLGRAAPLNDDDLTWCIGPPLIGTLEKLLGDRQQADAALSVYRERFSEIGLYENEIYPGIRDALTMLAASGKRLFVATSKPSVYAERVIDHFDLSGFFEAVFGSELDGTRADKTELLAWVLKETGVDPATTPMVGDRRYDIIGGRNNGMPTVGVLYGYGPRSELVDAGATTLCDKPSALPEALG